MRYYGYTIYFETIKDELRKYLKENNIYYELSKRFNNWHFEIKMSYKQMKNVSEFLNSIDKTLF